MHLGLSEDDLALRDGLREVLAGACTPELIRRSWEGDPCEQLWKSLGSFGLPGLLAGEDRGGLGLDAVAMVAALEECGWHGLPGPVVESVSHLPLAGLGLALDGSARLTVQQRGATVVPYAHVATHVYREDDHALLSAFTADPVASVDGSRQLARLGDGAANADLHVSAASQSTPGQPLARDLAVLGTAAFLLGLARRQLDLTLAYVKDRRQFGVQIGSFQALKHAIADAVVGTEFAWPAVLRAAQSLVDGETDADLHVAMAKALASEAAYTMSRVCLQAHGALGYTVEYDLHLFAKRTWALSKDWGTASQHRALLATRLGIERTAQ